MFCRTTSIARRWSQRLRRGENKHQSYEHQHNRRVATGPQKTTKLPHILEARLTFLNCRITKIIGPTLYCVVQCKMNERNVLHCISTNGVYRVQRTPPKILKSLQKCIITNVPHSSFVLHSKHFASWFFYIADFRICIHQSHGPRSCIVSRSWLHILHCSFCHAL